MGVKLIDSIFQRSRSPECKTHAVVPERLYVSFSPETDLCCGHAWDWTRLSCRLKSPATWRKRLSIHSSLSRANCPFPGSIPGSIIGSSAGAPAQAASSRASHPPPSLTCSRAQSIPVKPASLQSCFSPSTSPASPGHAHSPIDNLHSFPSASCAPLSPCTAVSSHSNP